MNSNKIKTFIEDKVQEYPQTQNRIRKINSEAMQKQKNPALPSRVDSSIQFMLPQLCLPTFTFQQFQKRVPRPPKIVEKPKFPIFNRLFSFIYYLIGQEGQGIWNQFGQLYSGLLPNQNTQIVNRSTYDNTDNLKQFIKSGLQVKLLVQVQDHKIKNLIPILQSKDIMSAHVKSERDIVRLPNVKLVTSIHRIFQKQVKNEVKKSCKQQIYFNFINIQSKFPQLFKRKNLIQKCLQPKDLDQYLQNHNNFMKMMETYENKRLIKQIQKEHSNIASFLFSQKIKTLREKIQKIQKQQKQFCQYFLDQLKKMHPIQEHQNKQALFLKIVQQYKMEHSIYEVLNNNIRLSICINETTIKCMSPLIKYMYQSVRYFFFKQLHTMKISQVYRGALLPSDEINELSQGRYLFNIGFMSTTKNKRIAQGFKISYGDNNQMAYLFIIKIGDYYKDKQLCQNQQGFFSISDQFRSQLIKQNNPEEEVLFNPLSIFKIIRIDKKAQVLQLQYAPHIRLMKKMRENSITPQQLKQYKTILPNIVMMNKSNYDRGQALRQKGKLKSAMNYYKQAEQKGESLTVDQKINKINILTQSKNFALVEKQINEMIKLEESAKEKDQQNLLKAVRLTKQSEHKQKLNDFVSAKKMAAGALQNSNQLMIELEKKQKSQNNKINNEQILESFIIKLKSRIQLAKSNFQTSYYEESIYEGWIAFNMIDFIYKIYEENILPLTQKLLSKQKINQNGSNNSLIQLTKLKMKNNVIQPVSIQKFNEIQQQSQKILKNIKLPNNHQKKDKTTQNQLKQRKLEKLEKLLTQYFKNRQISRHNYMKLYKAAVQIQNYICSTLQLKKIKNLLETHKSKIQSIMDLELNLFNLMTTNMRCMSLNILPCMKNQKDDFFESRFQKFIKINQKQMSTDHIKYRTRYYEFLLEYSNLQKQNSSEGNINESQKMQDQTLNQLQKLNKEVKQQSQKQKQAFTIQKTMIIEVETNHYKNYCLESQIIQKAASYHKTHNKSNQQQTKLFHTIQSYKSKQTYILLKQKLSTLQQIHESDENINKFHYVLQDVNNLVSVMNQSFEARSQLNQANKKLQYFMKTYLYQTQVQNIKKSINQKNQQIAFLYYLAAQNKLRRGYHFEAEIELNKAQKILTDIYGHEQFSLHARQISIKCYRLQSEIVGMYGDYTKRGNCLNRLCKIKAYFQQKIYNPSTLVLINEAVAFIAVRCLPNQISPLTQPQNFQTHIFQEGEKALQRAITLRSQLLGNQNEFIVTAYSFIVSLLAKMPISQNVRQKIHQNYDEGRKAFIELQKNKQQIDKSPILYIYKMKMYANYEKSKIQPNNEQISNIYCQNVSKFFTNYKDLRGLFLAEQFFEAGKHLFDKSNKKQHLLFAQKLFIRSQQDLNMIIKYNSQGDKSLLITLLSKVCNQLQKLYKLNKKADRYELYRKKVSSIERKQSIQIPRLKNQDSNPTVINSFTQLIARCLGSQKKIQQQ